MVFTQGHGIALILIFVGFMANAQNSFENFDGKVKSESSHIPNVHVINRTSKKATITNAHGYYSIPAKLHDTILFSSIQFEKLGLVVTAEVLESEIVEILLKEKTIELEEVLVTPYNLTGDIHKDIQSIKLKSEVTTRTLGLPNANVKKLTINERKLFLAMQEQALHRLLDEITGHNKKLRKLVHVDNMKEQIETVKDYYPDSLFSQRLHIPLEKIDDFMYFCAVDSSFSSTLKSRDKLKFLEFLEEKSPIYRKNINLTKKDSPKKFIKD